MTRTTHPVRIPGNAGVSRRYGADLARPSRVRGGKPSRDRVVRSPENHVTGGRGLIRYSLVWLVAGAAVALLAVLVIGSGGGEGDDYVTLPPVRFTELSSAADAGGCDLRVPALSRRANPAASGLRGAAAARPGVYERPPDREALLAALRQGVVVIEYHPDLARDEIDRLEALQPAVPAGTVVTPSGTRTQDRVVATAWRRLLRCPEVSSASIDAIRLFRGRFIGSGPENGP